MTWSKSLVRLSTYEVETLQRRLSEIVERRTEAELRLAMLHAEGEAETIRAREDAHAGWYMIGYAEGLKQRKAAVEAEIAGIALEEEGARDALGLAFEAQKKYEHVAEAAKLADRREQARRENAALDEMAQRRAAGR